MSFLLNIVGYVSTNLKKRLIIIHQQQKPFRQFVSVLGLILLFFSSCSVTRDVPDKDYLLNKVKIDVPNRNIKSSIKSLAKQKENRKILWTYRFKLRFYSSLLFKKDSDSRMRHSVGEPPVIYDTVSAQNSVKKIHDFLKNKGFYSNTVSIEEKYRSLKSKKLKLIYHIETNEPTVIADITNEVYINNIAVDLAREENKSLLHVGDNFDIDVLEKERKRLARLMKNEGYFFFSNDLIYFNADTIKEKRKVFLTYKIKEDPVKYFGDSVQVNPYTTYKIKNVYIRQDFGERFSQIVKKDTVGKWGYYFLDEATFTVKPKVISRSIFHNSNDFYLLENHENTYRRLIALNNYKYVNISYRNAQDSLPNYLDCFISMSPSKPKSFSIETNGTNTGGILGVNGTFSILHRNAFRGAELLRLSLYGGLEAQSVKSGQDVVENTPFNTVELAPEISLVLPKFLLPIDENRFSKRNIPKTTLTVSYNYQRRPDYTRNILNAGLIYSWKESKTKSHAIQPINISEINILKSKEFQQKLDSLDNSSLKASYDDNFITSFMYSFVYNNKIINKERSFHIFRSNVEFAGNLIYVLDKNVFNSSTNENGQYEINGIPYAQYFRTFVEYTPHLVINKSNSFVSRTFVGVGIPYGNAFAMPFVKSFYGGGTNGIRAWQARSLGPGTISNDKLQAASVDQIGDIKLEQNFEYRFGIIKYLEGAVFMDIGNIWVLNNPEFADDANFAFSKIWKGTAIGGGIGARLNFDYFVIRFDVAKRVKDPGEIDPYAIKFFYAESAILNFAIGYPF